MNRTSAFAAAQLPWTQINFYVKEAYLGASDIFWFTLLGILVGNSREGNKCKPHAVVKSYPFSESFPSALKIQTRALCNSMSHESLLEMKLITVFPSVRLWFSTRCHSSHLHQHRQDNWVCLRLLPQNIL